MSKERVGLVANLPLFLSTTTLSRPSCHKGYQPQELAAFSSLEPRDLELVYTYGYYRMDS